jgi:ribosome assembly protein YihI (activator of Der GTPase)
MQNPDKSVDQAKKVDRAKQEALWATEFQNKALSSLEQVDSELKALREAVAKGESLSLGRTQFLAKLLDSLREVRGAW